MAPPFSPCLGMSPHSSTLSIQAYLHTAFTVASGSAVVAHGIPSALRHGVAMAQATVAKRASRGSVRHIRTLTRFAALARDAGVSSERADRANLDALAVNYAIARLRPSPPYGWRPIKSAKTPSSDVSSLAAAARRASLEARPHMGPLTKSFLAARGAFAKVANSSAYPWHLADVLAAQLPASHPMFLTWMALLTMSLFCLRTGVTLELTKEQFIHWHEDVHILVWKYVHKTDAGDVDDPELRSTNPNISAAAHPLMHQFLVGAKGPLFTGVTGAGMSEFVRQRLPAVPSSFRLCAYGVRVAAAAEAQELGLDTDAIDTLFWWKRTSPSTRLHYAGQSLSLQIAFSRARCSIHFIHVQPGRYLHRLDESPPDWSKIAISRVPLPPVKVALIDASLAAEPRWATVPELRRESSFPTPFIIDLPPPCPATAPSQLPRVDHETSSESSSVDSSSSSASASSLPSSSPMRAAMVDDEGRVLAAPCSVCAAWVGEYKQATRCDRQYCTAIVCTACKPIARRVWFCVYHGAGSPGKRPRLGD